MSRKYHICFGIEGNLRSRVGGLCVSCACRVLLSHALHVVCISQAVIAGRAGAVRCGRQLAVLLSADSAALGVWQDGVLERHKVLTGYTVRRKAGKAQLTHLRRWGPRMRAASWCETRLSCRSTSW